MSNKERAKETLRRLLNVAKDSGSTENEIEIATRTAAHYMAAYQLTPDDVVEEKPKTPRQIAEDFVYTREFLETKGIKATSWEVSLAIFLCDILESVGHYFKLDQLRTSDAGLVLLDKKTQKPLQTTRLYFYGVAEEVEIAKAIYVEYQLVIAAMALMKTGTMLSGPGRAYADGFVSGLQNKFKIEQDKQAQQDVNTRTLIRRAHEIAIAKKEKAKDFIADLGIVLSELPPKKLKQYDTYYKGYKDGTNNTVNISKKNKIK